MEKRSVFLLCIIFILANTTGSYGINLTELVTPENEELVNVLREELDLFHVEMTKSFMEAHSRRKRGLVSDININDDKFLEIPNMKYVGPFSTFTFNKDLYMIKDDGIYRMNDMSSLAAKRLDATQNFNSEKFTRVGSWKLKENQIVLHGYQWRKTFLFFTTQGSFSEIYTIHADSMQPVYRQRVFHDGIVTDAQFYEYRRSLYLVYSVDNEHHTTSDSKIYTWRESYMDAIHTIQTFGASAVTAFTINSKNYIAIAQSKDSSGNRLVGTILLCMDPSERLQRTQLLWSKGAVSLQYITTEKEHFLLIGQDEESSIMYWFGGMDFLFWQSLDGLQGSNLVMDGIQMTADEPMIIASDGTLLKFFSRAVSATELKSNWVQSRFVDLKKSDFRISHAKFLTVDADNTYLAISRQVAGSNLESLRIYKVNLFQRELTVTTAQEKGDSLSQCMHSLSMSLSEAKPILARIEEKRQTVLTTNGNWNFKGVLVSDKIVKSDSTKSKIATAQITPELQRAGPSDRFKTAPSQLFSSIQDKNIQLDSLKSDLNNIMFKSSRPNTISAKLRFADVQFNNLQAPRSTDLKVDVLNNVRWTDITNSALKLSSAEPQEVNAEWQIESLVADATIIEQENSLLSPTNFLRKTCAESESQSVTGTNQFNDNIRVLNGMNLGPAVTINTTPFSDVVLKQNKNQKISGFKHAENVKGDFIVERVNHKQLESWFLDVAKLSSSAMQEFTGPIKFMEDAALKIDKIKLENLNSVEWNKFKENVLLDEVPQHIQGAVSFENLRADHIKANVISDVQSEDMLTADSDQQILSKLTLENLHIKGPLTSQKTNGVHLSDAVNRNEKQVVINGPVTLDSCRVEHVFIADDKTIGGKDVSSLKNLEKTHIYTTVNEAPIVLRNLNVEDLDTDLINDARVAGFKTEYWSKSKNNVVNLQELVLSDKSVFVDNEDFRTHTVNGFNFPNDLVPMGQSDVVINTKLNFVKSVTSLEDVTIPHGKTINKIDMSEVQEMIVDENFDGVVRGEKTFTFPVVATNGASFGKFNGMNLLADALMLTTLEPQVIEGTTTFDSDVIMDHLTMTNGNVDVQGLVNQVNLESVRDTTAYKNGVNDIQGELIFNKAVNVDQFTTANLNEINLQEITENMVFLNQEERQIIDREIQVTNGQIDFLDDSHANQINDIDVSNYLSQVVRVDQKRSDVIRGNKQFKDVNLGQLMCTQLNGVDMINLGANALSKTKSQVLEGVWSLGNVHFKENLETDAIGGVLLDNIMHTDQSFEVVSPVQFTSHRTRIEGPLTVTGKINGIALDENMRQGVSISSPTNFEQVSINGNLAWDKSLSEAKRLSYLFDSAVTPFGSQTISSAVAFAGGFTSESSSSSEWLNNVDLQAVADDALLTDDVNWVLSGNNRFAKGLQIDSLSRPVEILDVTTINNVNMHTISDEIVRKTDDFSDGRVIRGMKEFNNDIKLQDLDIRDAIAEVPMTDFVVKNDQRAIQEAQFANVIVQEDMDFGGTSGMNLQSMLNNRVSLTKQQELQGSYAFENVDATRQCDLEQINGITLQKTVTRDGRQLPFLGTKVFKHGVTVEGDMDTPVINNHNVKDLAENTLRVNRPEVVTRAVVFESPVVVNKRMDADSVNGVNFPNFDKDVSRRIGRLMNEAEGPDVLAADLAMRTKQLQLFSQTRSVWLEYLIMKQDLTELGPKSRVNHVKTSNNGDILVTFHHSSDGQDAGLPKGCSCNSVDTVSVNELREHKTQLVGTRSCVQIFHVTSPTGRAYTVKSETPSSNLTCMTDADKTTNIFLDKTLIADLDMGHVSDVGVFTDGGVDYLICAQYFDKNSLSHSTTTKVLRVDNGKIEELQNIETHGAKKVALEVINDRWMLAIANSKNSLDESSCNADSAIYAWSAEHSEFELLRTIMTMGAHDVQFITSESHDGFEQDSFVALAQEGSAASGEVMIYKFEQLGGNFAPFQTIRSEWPITSLKSVCTCSSCFLTTVAPKTGITMYDARCVEGFKEYLTVPVVGASDVSTFTMDGMQIFAIATANGPILAEAVMSARCMN